MNSDWQTAAEILTKMAFNQLFRESPVEALIRVFVNQHVNGIRILEKECSWTNCRSSSGHVVLFGNADSGGASIDYWYPGYESDDLGFFLSRSSLSMNCASFTL